MHRVRRIYRDYITNVRENAQRHIVVPKGVQGFADRGRGN